MPVLRIPTPLRAYTSGKSEVSVGGANVGEALTDLTAQYPTIKPHLFNEGGELRPFVNLFLGENNIKDLQGVNTPITDGDKLVLIPSIAGGCRCECTLRSNLLVVRGDCFVGISVLSHLNTLLTTIFATGG